MIRRMGSQSRACRIEGCSGSRLDLSISVSTWESFISQATIVCLVWLGARIVLPAREGDIVIGVSDGCKLTG